MYQMTSGNKSLGSELACCHFTYVSLTEQVSWPSPSSRNMKQYSTLHGDRGRTTKSLGKDEYRRHKELRPVMPHSGSKMNKESLDLKPIFKDSREKTAKGWSERRKGIQKEGTHPECKVPQPSSTHLSACSRLSPTRLETFQVCCHQSLYGSQPSSKLLILAFSCSLARKTHTALRISKLVQPGQLDPSVCTRITSYTNECVCQQWLPGSFAVFSCKYMLANRTLEQFPNGLHYDNEQNFLYRIKNSFPK